MKRDIRDIRRDIAGRKKKKLYSSGSVPPKKWVAPPGDEEVHGYPPLVTSSTYGREEPSGSKGTSRLGLQMLFAVLLFGVVALGKNTELPVLSGPGEWAVSQMQEEFPFASVSAWYSERFGDPLQVIQPVEDGGKEPLAMPVSGTVTTSFQNDGKGIIMRTENDSQVKAVRAGTVIFAGKDEDTGNTVTLQHEDGTKTTYGYLSSIDVHLYENVKAQKGLGSVEADAGESAAEFFFAVEKDDQFLDPAEVIQVNEGS
ncbi:M23 family metallopeptidase [Bacillus sp. SB49]|uniref:M23 family metallopeptidase n=1 Tax=Bacillaceae TaxID=186817 RepID=UPI0002A501A8|nr:MULTISPECIES: M23 family metallopeptidase [Bacillaceae]ELK45708.1 stage IV sporulation protein FA [Halobacillus sp. BAB-2008]QHT47293.1 M23 family metallopeptidase [Bacillus sp. SB49]